MYNFNNMILRWILFPGAVLISIKEIPKMTWTFFEWMNEWMHHVLLQQPELKRDFYILTNLIKEQDKKEDASNTFWPCEWTIDFLKITYCVIFCEFWILLFSKSFYSNIWFITFLTCFFGYRLTLSSSVDKWYL